MRTRISFSRIKEFVFNATRVCIRIEKMMELENMESYIHVEKGINWVFGKKRNTLNKKIFFLKRNFSFYGFLIKVLSTFSLNVFVLLVLKK